MTFLSDPYPDGILHVEPPGYGRAGGMQLYSFAVTTWSGVAVACHPLIISVRFTTWETRRNKDRARWTAHIPLYEYDNPPPGDRVVIDRGAKGELYCTEHGDVCFRLDTWSHGDLLTLLDRVGIRNSDGNHDWLLCPEQSLVESMF